MEEAIISDKFFSQSSVIFKSMGMFLEVAVKLRGFVKDFGLVKALQAIVAIMGLPDETRLLTKGGALLQITTVAIVCVSLVAIIEVTSGAFLRL